MLRSHFYFALVVGAALLLLGNALLAHSSMGWTLVTLGGLIPALAAMTQHASRRNAQKLQFACIKSTDD